MSAQVLTSIQVSEKAEFRISEEFYLQDSEITEGILALGRKRHEVYRVIRDFRGPINLPVYSRDGQWLYYSLREQDKAIIPKAAFRRHAAVEKAGYKVAQVLIGHDLTQSAPELTVATSKPKTEIDWGNVAEVAGKGLLVGMMGIAMISIYALAGAVQLVDPSYCIVLDDNQGTVIELIRWNG